MGSSLDSKSLKLIVEAVELARAKESVMFVDDIAEAIWKRNPQSADSSSTSQDRDPEERNNGGFYNPPP